MRQYGPRGLAKQGSWPTGQAAIPLPRSPPVSYGDNDTEDERNSGIVADGGYCRPSLFFGIHGGFASSILLYFFLKTTCSRLLFGRLHIDLNRTYSVSGHATCLGSGLWYTQWRSNQQRLVSVTEKVDALENFLRLAKL